MKINLLGWILICFIILIILRIYWDSDALNLKCIISNVDGNTYCVRERLKLQLVADLLARVTQKMKKLVSIILPLVILFLVSGCANDCMNSIERADMSVIGTWRDDIKVDQKEFKKYEAWLYCDK